MKIKMEKQIIRQGGSLVVTLTPAVLSANGFALGDIVDVTIEHIKEDFDETQANSIFVRLAGQKMRRMGVRKLSITLKDEEIRNKEKQEDETTNEENTKEE